jgi:hypothetical protein
MLGQKVLPAILLLSPAAIALLSVHTTVVEAASNECKAKPDSAAPAGSRWYYRVSRVDQSRCWFLSSRDVSVHSRLSQTAPVTRSHVITPTSEAPVTQQDRQIGPQIASAIEPAEEQLALGQTTVPQRAPDPPRSDDLLARNVATVSYRPAVAGTRPASGALVQAQPSGARDASIADFNVVFLGAVVATGLSLAGAVFHLTRRVRSRDYALADRPNADQRIITDPLERIVPGLEKAKQQLSSIAQATRRQPTGPQRTRRQPTGLTADDLNRSVRELRRNLEQAGFARAAVA